MFSTAQATNFEESRQFRRCRKRTDPETHAAFGRAVTTQNMVKSSVGRTLIESNVDHAVCPHGSLMNNPGGIGIGMNLYTRCPALRQKPLRHISLRRSNGLGVFFSRRETAAHTHAIHHRLRTDRTCIHGKNLRAHRFGVCVSGANFSPPFRRYSVRSNPNRS